MNKYSMPLYTTCILGIIIMKVDLDLVSKKYDKKIGKNNL